VLIVEASASDLEDVLAVSRVAFEGEDVPTLVRGLMDDPSARPLLSLIAVDGGRTMGHALFSAARVEAEEDSASAVILGPLAVVPEAQRKGVGGLLLEAGCRRLGESGIELVFLAGDPGYYSRHGFEPAHRHGFLPPFPVTPEEAWMVRALTPDALGLAAGEVICADALNKAEHWRE